MPGNMTNFTLDMIRNRESLNIFTDVSTRRENCCYGAVAVHMDDIIDQRFITHNNCSNSGGEIRGIRTGLSLGFLHRNDFRCINIFSDSVYAIKGIKEWFFGSWYYNPIDNRLYTATNKTPVAHQSVFIECTMQLDMLRKTNIVNIYHIKAHVDNGPNNIREATNIFRNINNINGRLDYNAIRYCVIYNNYIDNTTRSVVRTTNFRNNTYNDGVSFVPFMFQRPGNTINWEYPEDSK